MKKNILFTLAAAGLLLVSCGGGTSSSSASTIPSSSSASQSTGTSGSSEAVITSVAVELEDGATVVYIGSDNGVTAIAKVNGVESEEVTWSVSDTEVLSIDNTGWVYGKKAGKAKIIATSTKDTSKKGELEVTVEAKPAVITKMSNLKDGESYTVRGRIGAITKGGVYVDDGTAVVQLYWKNGSPDSKYKVGQVLTITGTVVNNNYTYGEFEFEMESKTPPTIVIETEGEVKEATIDKPAELTAASIADLTQNAFRAKAVKFKATAETVNDKVNWKLGDYYISYKAKPDSFPSLVPGVEYTVVGYLLSYNSTNKYFPLAAVTVDGDVAPVESLELDKTEVTVAAGNDVTVTPTVSPKNAIQNIVWESADDTIAKVSSKGVITGLKVGETTVTAKTEGKTAAGEPLTKTVTVKVTEAQTPALPLEGDFSQSSSSGAVLPYGWTASSKDGYSGGLKANKAGYWVKSREFNASNTGVDVSISVKALNKSSAAGAHEDDDVIFLVEGFASTAADAQAVASAKVLSKDFKTEASVYNVELNETGIVQVKVTLVDRPVLEGVFANVNIDKINLVAGDYDPTHVPNPTSVRLNKLTLSLVEGYTETLTATVGPDGAKQNVTWSSSDTDIATVDANGKVTAVKAGSAKIRATAKGFDTVYAECALTVTADASNWGTKDAPITVAEAAEIIGGLEDKAVQTKFMCVKGMVSKIDVAGETYTLFIKDNQTGKEIEAYYLHIADQVAAPAVNDEITVYGHPKKFGTTLEIATEKDAQEADYAMMIANVRGNSAIVLGDHENATVTGLPESGTNGSTITFEVAAAAGYSVGTVTVYDKSITPGQDGKYSFVLAGPAVVKVTVAAEGTKSLAYSFSDEFYKGAETKWVLAAADNNKLVEHTAADQTVFNTINAYTGSGYVMLKSKDLEPALLANKTAVPGVITQITIKTTDGSSGNANINVALGKSAFEAAIADDTNSFKKGEFTLTASESDGFNYFGISSVNTKYNAQILSITITYVPAAN